MSFKEALKAKKFITTAEIFPPKGTDISIALDKALALKNIVDAINVTDNQRAVMRMNPIVLSHQIVLQGMDAICQMCCRDRNSLGLSSDLLAASALGIRNILAITGDYPLQNGNVVAKPVFELDSVQLLNLIKTLESGKDLHGAALKGVPSFCLGAVVNPNSEQQDLQIMKLKKKVDAGAEFIQTQVIYNVDEFKKFRDKTSNIKAKILIGIFPLKSALIARSIEGKVPGVVIGEDVIGRIENSKDQIEEGLNISIEIINELKPYCDGVHFMTMNDVDAVKKIVTRIN